MNKPEAKRQARKARGEITPEFTKQFEAYSEHDLSALLNDSNPQIRTASAQILGKRRDLVAIPNLCLRLKIEKALYVRLAVSDALSRIGTTAIPEMINYIGKIGGNQYRDLPSDIFQKWDYPLPRDIMIRSIMRMGTPALEELNQYLLKSDESVVCEIVDAIGHISFYSRDQSSFDNLLRIIAKHRQNELIVWKVLRALQAFPNWRAYKVLKHFLLNGNRPQFRWEAARSLGQIATKEAEEHLEMAKNDSNDKVRAMVQLALKHVHDIENNGSGG
jgi:HEAT repeat protein